VTSLNPYVFTGVFVNIRFSLVIKLGFSCDSAGTLSAVLFKFLLFCTGTCIIR